VATFGHLRIVKSLRLSSRALSCLQLQRFISGGFAYIFTIFENFVFENCLRRELFCVAKRELIACAIVAETFKLFYNARQ
jgi:hypothetical protein